MGRRGAMFGVLMAVPLWCVHCLQSHAEESNPCGGSADDAAMTSCWEKQVADAKADLAASVKGLSESLAEGYEEHPAALAKAQKDWERFVQSECEFTQFESLQGTMGGVYFDECIVKMYRARVAQFDKMRENP